MDKKFFSRAWNNGGTFAGWMVLLGLVVGVVAAVHGAQHTHDWRNAYFGLFWGPVFWAYAFGFVGACIEEAARTTWKCMFR